MTSPSSRHAIIVTSYSWHDIILAWHHRDMTSSSHDLFIIWHHRGIVFMTWHHIHGMTSSWHDTVVTWPRESNAAWRPRDINTSWRHHLISSHLMSSKGWSPQLDYNVFTLKALLSSSPAPRMNNLGLEIKKSQTVPPRPHGTFLILVFIHSPSLPLGLIPRPLITHSEADQCQPCSITSDYPSPRRDNEPSSWRPSAARPL